MNNQKQAIINALCAFVNQRPGFELGNYATMRDYRSDSRKATNDRDAALRLLRDIELRDSITADAILAEARSGRVQLRGKAASADDSNAHYFVDYCTGQYFPTEYRAAVARLCASVLWTWKRDLCMPAPLAGTDTYSGFEPGHKSPTAMSGGDWLRASFKREYGAGIAGRFFS